MNSWAYVSAMSVVFAVYSAVIFPPELLKLSAILGWALMAVCSYLQARRS